MPQQRICISQRHDGSFSTALPLRSWHRVPLVPVPRGSPRQIWRRAAERPLTTSSPPIASRQSRIHIRNSRTLYPARKQSRCAASHPRASPAFSDRAAASVRVSKRGCEKYLRKAARTLHRDFSYIPSDESTQCLPLPTLLEFRPAYETTCSSSLRSRRPGTHPQGSPRCDRASTRIQIRCKGAEILSTPRHQNPHHQSSRPPPGRSLLSPLPPEQPQRLLHPRLTRSRTRRT